MRNVWMWFAAVVLPAVLAMPGQARAQGAVAYTPGIGNISEGLSLSVVPAVSADRRYVRLSLNPTFQTIDGFQNFPIPFGVSGAGGTGGGRGGFGGLGGGLGGLGGVGGAGAGFRSVMAGMEAPAGPLDALFSPSFGNPSDRTFATRSMTKRQARAAAVKAARAKKPLPDPVVRSSKKTEHHLQ